MKALSFIISGRTAHFKRPDVNEHTYFTYSHIHKMTIYGIIGAVIGLRGYNDQDKALYPEFYEKLKNLEIAIVPIGSLQGRFRKKVHVFNNSVGYANTDSGMGQNLIVREQWLENVKWEIVLNLDSLEDIELKDKMVNHFMNNICVFIPYLGKNDHPAVISDVKMMDVEPIESEKIDSLFIKEDFELDGDSEEDQLPYLFQDQFPIGIDEQLFYIKKDACLTNQFINKTKQKIYLVDEKYITFI